MFLEKLSRIYTQLPFHSILNWLLPPCCILCEQYTQTTKNICKDCQNDLPILPQQCLQCGIFLYGLDYEMKCGSCLKIPPAFDLTYTLFPYQWPITSLIIKLKFQQQLCYAQTLGSLMVDKILTSWYKDKPFPDLIIPLPLHYKRLRERGFNQSLEIAKPLAKSLKINLDIHGVKRIKATQAQSGLSAKKRRENIASAFYSHRDYQGLTIAILDDVITTGNTVMECSSVLKKQGAKHIDVWCCARRG